MRIEGIVGHTTDADQLRCEEVDQAYVHNADVPCFADCELSLRVAFRLDPRAIHPMRESWSFSPPSR